MKKSFKKNAGSFYELCKIERGEVVNKIRLPSSSIQRFDPLKTDVFKTKMSDIFVIKDSENVLDKKL